MIIDDKRLFTPHRACTNSLKYTDHVSLHVKFKGIPEVKKGYQMDGKHVSWNTKKVKFQGGKIIRILPQKMKNWLI